MSNTFVADILPAVLERLGDERDRQMYALILSMVSGNKNNAVSAAQKAELGVFAAGKGFLDILSWLLDEGVIGPECLEAAAANDQQDAMELLRWRGVAWPGNGLVGASGNGRLDLMRWAQQGGCRFGPECIEAAAASNHKDVVEWLRSRIERTSWPSAGLVGACGNGHLDLVRWAHANGCVFRSECIEAAAETNRKEVVEYLAVTLRVPWPRNGLVGAAYRGHCDLMRWCLDRGCGFDVTTIASAARGGRIDILEIFEAHDDLPEDMSYASLRAAMNGHIGVVEWLDEKELWYDREQTLQTAAVVGRLNIVKHLVSKGCEPSSKTATDAVTGGNADILEWLVESGYPVDVDECVKQCEMLRNWSPHRAHDRKLARVSEFLKRVQHV
jgi:hypothetical protein